MLSTQEKARIKKLNCKDLLDLALFIPKSYVDTSYIQDLDSLPISGVVQVIIHSTNRGGKFLKICAFMKKFNKFIELIIFNPKSYHFGVFKVGSTLDILGKIQRSPTLSMIQPKIATQNSQITPIFAKTTLKNSTIVELTQKLITFENLSSLDLPKDIIYGILPIFHPTKHIASANELPKESIYALKFVEIYKYIKSLNKKRRYHKANYVCNGKYQSFIDSLPFELTKGQKETIEQISKDLSSTNSAKRLIMGDVGCGKTIVILSSVVMAYPHKSILMAPTTILAQQLYEEAIKFLPKNIKVALITAKESGKKIPEGDFFIGTQALLFQDDIFDGIGLLMSDEQHRFGTNQRFKLEKFASMESSKPHILQFSATPIPRTMAMLNSNLIDHSFIRDLPFKKNIKTSIIGKSDFSHLLSHIQNQIASNHQTIIVYPLVEESEIMDYVSLSEGESFWKKHFSGVYTTSGKDKDKQNIIQDFRNNGNILLSTTLIEVGISLPRLTTIVIVGAERMGLATLHQLRGRVSRNGLDGYCFLYTNKKNNPRLMEFAKSTNGFEIAELDLKYRNSGDLLDGSRQSGENFRFFDLSSDGQIASRAIDICNKTKIQLDKNLKE